MSANRSSTFFSTRSCLASSLSNLSSRVFRRCVSIDLCGSKAKWLDVAVDDGRLGSLKLLGWSELPSSLFLFLRPGFAARGALLNWITASSTRRISKVSLLISSVNRRMEGFSWNASTQPCTPPERKAFVGIGAFPTAWSVEDTTAFGSRAGGQPVELNEKRGTTDRFSAVILESFGRTAVRTKAICVSQARQAIPRRVTTSPAKPSFSRMMMRISPRSRIEGVQKRGTTVWSFLAGFLSRKSRRNTGSRPLD